MVVAGMAEVFLVPLSLINPMIVPARMAAP
jgi:hypothetical protein